MYYYEKMYYELFNKITDVIKDLQAVQQKTEEIFINEADDLAEDDFVAETIKHLADAVKNDLSEGENYYNLK